LWVGELPLSARSHPPRRPAPCSSLTRPQFRFPTFSSLKQHPGRANALPAATDREAVAKAAREVAVGGVHFVWTQLGALDALQRGRAEAKRGLLELHAQRRAGGEVGEVAMPSLHDGSEAEGPGGARSPAADEAVPAPDAAPPADPDLASVLTALDAHVDRLYTALPPNTLLIVTTCQGDTHDTRRLQQQAYRRAQGLDGLQAWSPACEAYLDRLREKGMQALCFASVKQ